MEFINTPKDSDSSAPSSLSYLYQKYVILGTDHPLYMSAVHTRENRSADSGKERHSSNNRKKARVKIEDSDNSGDESNILVLTRHPSQMRKCIYTAIGK